jgi:hypothetical protein
VLNALALFLLLRASLEARPSAEATGAIPPDEERRPTILVDKAPVEPEAPPVAETEQVAPVAEVAAKEDAAPQARKKVFFPA